MRTHLRYDNLDWSGRVIYARAQTTRSWTLPLRVVMGPGKPDSQSSTPHTKSHFDSHESIVPGPPADTSIEAAPWKPPKASGEISMATDGQDNTRPNPTRTNWNWNPSPAADKPDRTTFEASRRAELDLIRLIDIKCRQPLGYFHRLKIHRVGDLRDRYSLSSQKREKHDRVAHEMQMSHRLLVHAVEGYLSGCVHYPDLTGEGALKRATSTDSLIDLLQAEEDLAIKTFGPPWLERPHTLSRSCLKVLQPPKEEKEPTRGGAPSGTSALRSWPWR
jgi:hypothetical protein